MLRSGQRMAAHRKTLSHFVQEAGPPCHHLGASFLTRSPLLCFLQRQDQFSTRTVQTRATRPKLRACLSSEPLCILQSWTKSKRHVQCSVISRLLFFAVQLSVYEVDRRPQVLHNHVGCTSRKRISPHNSVVTRGIPTHLNQAPNPKPTRLSGA